MAENTIQKLTNRLNVKDFIISFARARHTQITQEFYVW